MMQAMFTRLLQNVKEVRDGERERKGEDPPQTKSTDIETAS